MEHLVLGVLLVAVLLRPFLSARFYYVRKRLFWRPLWKIQARLKKE